MSSFPLLESWGDRPASELTVLDSAIFKEIQTILKIIRSTKHPGGYYVGQVDGKFGKLTTTAFEDFKKDHWLGEPTKIGKTTVRSLLEMCDGVHPVSEQMQVANFILLPKDILGSKTGRSMLLPTGEIVWENQCIVEGIPLTWGEFTKGCTRVPEEKRLVANAIKFAKGFGEIREKYNAPIGINSGYRTPLANKQCGGARMSQHVQALAGDIRALDGNMPKLLKVVKGCSGVSIGLGGCKGFWHIDYRSGTPVIFGYGC
jgi:hypothetical protein